MKYPAMDANQRTGDAIRLLSAVKTELSGTALNVPNFPVIT